MPTPRKYLLNLTSGYTYRSDTATPELTQSVKEFPAGSVAGCGCSILKFTVSAQYPLTADILSAVTPNIDFDDVTFVLCAVGDTWSVAVIGGNVDQFPNHELKIDDSWVWHHETTGTGPDESNLNSDLAIPKVRVSGNH
jgi:hypothetical protein